MSPHQGGNGVDGLELLCTNNCEGSRTPGQTSRGQPRRRKFCEKTVEHNLGQKATGSLQLLNQDWRNNPSSLGPKWLRIKLG